MTGLNVNALRHRVTLQAVSRADDGGGGGTESWADVADLWASIRPSTGSESVEAGRITGKVSHVIGLRYRDDVAPAMRFAHESRLFDILAVLDPGEDRRWLTCLCEEREL